MELAQERRLDAELARLRAEAQDVPFEYTGLDLDMSMQEAIYGHRKAEFNAKVEGFAQRLDEISANISRAESDADGYQKRLNVVEENSARGMMLRGCGRGTWSRHSGACVRRRSAVTGGSSTTSRSPARPVRCMYGTHRRQRRPHRVSHRRGRRLRQDCRG